MLDSFFSSADIVIFSQLTLAMILGSLLGLERAVVAGKSAGVRTYALVSLGACLFFIVSVGISPVIAGGIITGVGFLGAGLVIKENDNRPHGLTTAAGLWVSAAIGMIVGAGNFTVAIFATFLTLFVFNALWFVEHKLQKLSHPDSA